MMRSFCSAQFQFALVYFNLLLLLTPEVTKTEFIHTLIIEIKSNSQIHFASTSELTDSLNRKITQAINKPVKIMEFQTLNCLPFWLKNVHYVGDSAVEIHKTTTNMATVFPAFLSGHYALWGAQASQH